MKAIINGTKYDTDTASEVACWDSGDKRDVHYREEALYQKPNGEFFLYGSGGPGSAYAIALDDRSYTSGQAIIPMAESKAREWAENRLSCDEYESIFGEVAE